MGLDSTAYTLVAPAWTAKKDRMPEPQHTSRTTYQGRRGGSRDRFSYNFSRYSLSGFHLTDAIWSSPKSFRKCEKLTFFCAMRCCLYIVKRPQSTNMHFKMIGDSKALLALCMRVTWDSPFPWSRPHLLKWLFGRCWSSGSLGEGFAAAADSSGTTHKYTQFQWFSWSN